MNLRILFVDDERYVLDGLRRILRPFRHQWQADFALGPLEALELLEKARETNPPDVVVSDMRMPVMDGAQLLAEVRARIPGSVRLLLSGQCEPGAIGRGAEFAHQFLSKPCEAEVLRTALAWVGAIRQRLPGGRFREFIHTLRALPVLPEHAEFITPSGEEARLSAEEVAATLAKIAQQDVGFATKVMQLASTGFFGRPLRAITPAEAIAALELKEVRRLGVDAENQGKVAESPLLLALLRQINLYSAQLAREVESAAREAGLPDSVLAHAYCAGMFRGVGIIVLAMYDPEVYGQILEAALREARPRQTLLALEVEAFGADHPTAGAYLLALWGIPEAVVDAIVAHAEVSPSVLWQASSSHAKELHEFLQRGSRRCSSIFDYLAQCMSTSSSGERGDRFN